MSTIIPQRTSRVAAALDHTVLDPYLTPARQEYTVANFHHSSSPNMRLT